MEITEIIKGHINEALNANQDLSEERIKICKQCPLYIKKSYGEVCNNELFLNKETGDVSVYPKNGYYRGCGCRLKAKTTLITAHCPVGKW